MIPSDDQPVFSGTPEEQAQQAAKYLAGFQPVLEMQVGLTDANAIAAPIGIKRLEDLSRHAPRIFAVAMRSLWALAEQIEAKSDLPLCKAIEDALEELEAKYQDGMAMTVDLNPKKKEGEADER